MIINVIVGSHSRHAWIVKNVLSAYSSYKFRLLIMTRDDINPVSKYVENPLVELVNLHFKERDKWEDFFYKNISINDFVQHNCVTDVKFIKSRELNSSSSKKWISKYKSSLTLTIGCLILDNDFLELLGQNTLNLHIGLSPWYKGSATLFWPNYNLEPQMSGLTFHRLSKLTDGGGIISQSIVELDPNDHLQKHSARVLFEGISHYIDCIHYCLKNPYSEGVNITSPGRLYLIKHWRPEHLKPIYNLTDGYVIKYLNDIGANLSAPKLYSLLS